MSISKEAALRIVKYVHAETNPMKPQEAEIIGNILQNHEKHELWRFKRHVFCQGCRRELSVLDMFLSGLKFHGPQFFSDFIYKGLNTQGGEIIYTDNSELTIQVFKHGLPITCVVCGVVHGEGVVSPLGCDYYSYERPGGLTDVTISMSASVYQALQTKIG